MPRDPDWVIGGFRYATGSRPVGSLPLGLFNDSGTLDHVGFRAALDSPAMHRAGRAAGRPGAAANGCR
ncbi:MAG: hypothetical protein J0J01_28310 [Reyranella sp.]|nr:hypothetical protein [Reyranella sp.]